MRTRQSLQKPMPVPTTGPQNFRCSHKSPIVIQGIAEEKEKVSPTFDKGYEAVAEEKKSSILIRWIVEEKEKVNPTLAKGYEALAKEKEKGYATFDKGGRAEEKEKVDPTFDLHKTYLIDHHVKLINLVSDHARRQNVKPWNMRLRQSLQKPMPVPITGPQNFRLQLQPQVPDIDLTWGVVEEKEKVYSSRPSPFPQLLTTDMRQ
ncbi:MAG: hypothetical protein M1839_005910 [Geoglossum umbratile]|nr:MAG: hypothetical protein M1839_005910 [Geoglossum umbratile]